MQKEVFSTLYQRYSQSNPKDLYLEAASIYLLDEFPLQEYWFQQTKS